MFKPITVFSAILLFVGIAFSAGGGSGPSGGVPSAPTVVYTDTAAHVFIFLTLRQPPGPPSPLIYVDEINRTTDSEYVKINAVGPGPEDRGETWFVYRAPWALFDWDDITMFGSDSTLMIDPIESATYADSGNYNWTGTSNTTYDRFLDTVLVSSSKGVGDPDVNYFYTVVAQDSLGHTSDRPSAPIGEYDQRIVVFSSSYTRNIVSYPLVDHDVESHGNQARYLAEKIPGCEYIYKWNAANQTEDLLAMKMFGTWYNFGTVKPGRAYIIYLADTFSAGDTLIWSLGYNSNTGTYYTYYGTVPKDTCFYFTKKAGSAAGYNIFAVPYQEYNILIDLHGSYPLPAHLLAQDIDNSPDIDALALYRWVASPPYIELLAIKIGGVWIGMGGSVYPGEPLVVLIQSSGGYWPACP